MAQGGEDSFESSSGSVPANLHCCHYLAIPIEDGAGTGTIMKKYYPSKAHVIHRTEACHHMHNGFTIRVLSTGESGGQGSIAVRTMESRLYAVGCGGELCKDSVQSCSCKVDTMYLVVSLNCNTFPDVWVWRLVRLDVARAMG